MSLRCGHMSSPYHDPFGPGSNVQKRFIQDQAKLKTLVESLKELGMRVVLTQGVYDLIHEGHATYLEKAKSLGDILIVGIDSDELTKIRKGPKRPIVPQQERVNMLLHLRHVDLVTIKEAHHGIGDIIEIVKPDVMVFSSSTNDVTPTEISAYQQYCGEIVTLPAQATTTTTARVRNLTIEGAETLAKEVNELITKFLSQIRNT
jgi:D-glycero-beta-D-manno-heptose 1-phosphate adenylyltransferase